MFHWVAGDGQFRRPHYHGLWRALFHWVAGNGQFRRPHYHGLWRALFHWVAGKPSGVKAVEQGFSSFAACNPCGRSVSQSHRLEKRLDKKLLNKYGFRHERQKTNMKDTAVNNMKD